VTLINDPKKVGNINIMLSKFKKFNNDEIKNGIINLDPKILNPETASTWLQYMPEPDEMNNCKEFDGNPETLDAPSKFFLMVSKIPNY
jgi:hypothetical protein